MRTRKRASAAHAHADEKPDLVAVEITQRRTPQAAKPEPEPEPEPAPQGSQRPRRSAAATGAKLPVVKVETPRRVSGRQRPAVDYAVKLETPDYEAYEDEHEDEPATPAKRARTTRQGPADSDYEFDSPPASPPASPPPSPPDSPRAVSTPGPRRSTRATPKSTPNNQPTRKSTRTPRSTRPTPQATPQTRAAPKPTPRSSGRKRVAPVKAESASGSEYEAPAEAEPIVVDDEEDEEDAPHIVADPTPEPGPDGLVESRRYEKSQLHVAGFDKPLDVVADNHWVYLFYRFCAERHEMYYRRLAGVPRDQLTSDETMSSVHIGNVFRQLDPSSLMMRDKIIADGDQSVDEVCFRVFLYCQFYNADSWAALCGAATGGIPSWKHFAEDLPKMEDALHDLSLVQKKKIYLGGFQLVPPTVYFDPALNRNRDKNIFNYAASLRLVMAMMECGLPAMLKKCRYAVDASNVLQTIPTLGGFLSLNILCFLNDTSNFTWLYRDFATCGPGSRNYLRRIFGPCISNAEMEDAGLKWLTEQQFKYYARLGQDPPHEWENGLRPGMRVLDVENALCWAHRYVNAYMGQGKRRGNKKLKSFADVPLPRYDPAVTESCSYPAWCTEARHVNSSSQATWSTAAEDALNGQLDELGEDVYEIERVVAKRGRMFRVRWKGWPPEADTWESERTLRDGAEEALEEWIAWDKRIWAAIERIRTQMVPKRAPNGRPPAKVKGNVRAEREEIAKENARVKRQAGAGEDEAEADAEEEARAAADDAADSESDDSLDSRD